MEIFLLVLDGYEGTEDYLGVFSSAEDAYVQQELVREQCRRDNEERLRLDALREGVSEEDAPFWDSFPDYPKFAYAEPERICVLKLIYNVATVTSWACCCRH